MYDDNDPENEEYDDDEYKYYPDGGMWKDAENQPNKKKFQIDWSAWEEWLEQALSDIVSEEDNVWIVQNNKNPKDLFMYLGINIFDENIWKSKFNIKDSVDETYKKHIQSHASYFLKQPLYYRGLFDNMN